MWSLTEKCLYGMQRRHRCVCAFPQSVQGLYHLTLVMLNLDMSCLCKQCRSRLVDFFRSQLICICTVCHLVSEFISTICIKESDWLKIRNGHGNLIYSAWQGLTDCKKRDIWKEINGHRQTMKAQITQQILTIGIVFLLTHYRNILKYWDTLTPYHTCPKIWK